MTSPRPYGVTLCWAALLTIGAAGIQVAGALGQAPDSTFLYAVLLVCEAIQTTVRILVLALPTRTLLAGASAVNAAGLFVWIVVRTSGLHIGTTTWKPETLGLPDLYLPAMQLVAALFCGSLWGIDTNRVGGVRTRAAQDCAWRCLRDRVYR